MEKPFGIHRLTKLYYSYSNILKNQKNIKSKSCQKNNYHRKISENRKKMYSQLKTSKVLKAYTSNNKFNNSSKYINKFKNKYMKNNRPFNAKFNYNLKKISSFKNININYRLRENKKINDDNLKNINKKNSINENIKKCNILKSFIKIKNDKKNNNKLSKNPSINISNKIIPGLKNKLMNSINLNALINDKTNKKYNYKTFRVNLINRNYDNYFFYNIKTTNNIAKNFINRNHLKLKQSNINARTGGINTESNCSNDILNTLNMDNKTKKNEINMHNYTSKNSENNGIFETDNVTVTYDKKTGNKIVNNFYFMDTIGRGAYSKVKKCINLKTKEEFAVKIINKKLLRKKKKSYEKTKEGTLKINYMIDDALNEINIYKSFPKANKNIIQLFQILNDKTKDKTYLIMELANKGPLVTFNKKTDSFCINKYYRDDIYNEKLIKVWIYEIANGIKFLHENNIVHRDIKSDNILIDKYGHCKIADFGWSIKFKNDQEDLFTKTEGNIYFSPPEFVDGKSKKQFGYKPVDIWAFGVSIYTCIFKSLPFLPDNRDNIVELYKEIRENDIDYNKNGIKISKEMKTLLSHIFEKDPKKRYTAKDIVEYPWLKSK